MDPSSAIYPIAAEAGPGGLVGFLAGCAAKKILRIFPAIVGLIVAGLYWLDHRAR